MDENSGTAAVVAAEPAALRPDGRPVGKPFVKGVSGNPAGLPKGTISLSTRIKNILEGDIPLPKQIAETIRNAVGEDKKPIDALIIVGMLQGLQGDKGWAEWLTHNGFGKPTDTVRLQGDAENPLMVASQKTADLTDEQLERIAAIAFSK